MKYGSFTEAELVTLIMVTIDLLTCEKDTKGIRVKLCLEVEVKFSDLIKDFTLGKGCDKELIRGLRLFQTSVYVNHKKLPIAGFAKDGSGKAWIIFKDGTAF